MPIEHFQGKTAVITGAGSGIGKALAVALMARGCSIAGIDVRQDRLADLAADLGGMGVQTTVHHADVSDLAAVSRARVSILAAHSGVHLLVNAAGVSLAGPFVSQTPDDIAWVMGINFSGTVNCSHAFLPDLMSAEEAHIVNISSAFGLLGFANKAGYSASKFAVRGFSEALRMELRHSGIGVTLLYPGPVATNIVRDGRASSGERQRREAAFIQRHGLSADYVARRTLAGIQRNRARVVLGWDYRLIDLATRLFPSWTQAIAARLSARMPF